VIIRSQFLINPYRGKYSTTFINELLEVILDYQIIAMTGLP